MAGQALACPTADDIATGVRVTFDDDTFSILTRDETGAVIETQHTTDGEVFVFESANGLLETGYVEGGARDTFTYDFDTSNLLPLKTWSRAAGTQTVTDENGDEIERVGFSYHTLGESSLRIGSCDYDAIRVQTYYQFEDHSSMVELTYLTELGIPLNTAYRVDGVVDVYRAMSIKAE